MKERIEEYDQGHAAGYKAGLKKGRSERTAQLRGLGKALQRIVDAYNANPHPIHYKVSEAIQASKTSLQLTEADRITALHRERDEYAGN